MSDELMCTTCGRGPFKNRAGLNGHRQWRHQTGGPSGNVEQRPGATEEMATRARLGKCLCGAEGTIRDTNAEDGRLQFTCRDLTPAGKTKHWGFVDASEAARLEDGPEPVMRIGPDGRPLWETDWDEFNRVAR